MTPDLHKAQPDNEVMLQDTPDGSYFDLEKKGKKQKANLLKEMINGLTNYRVWLLAACYAYSFGVEVTDFSSPVLESCKPNTCVMIESGCEVHAMPTTLVLK